MRNRLNLACLLAISLCLLAAKPGVDVNGNWTGQLTDEEGHTGQVKFVLRQDAGRISGTAGPLDKQLPIYDAKLEGNHLAFGVDDSDDSGLSMTYHMDMTVAQDTMQGKAHGHTQNRTWTVDINLTRQK